MDQKRKLTQDEITYILEGVVYPSFDPIFNDTYTSITDRMRHYFYNKLVNIETYPQCIPKIKDELTLQFHRSLVHPGESVGVIAGQSIGERQTQTTLSAFHTAGVSAATVVTGVPRFSELLSATEKPAGRVSTIYFKSGNSSIKELRQSIKSDIVYLTIKDISTEITINTELITKPWYDAFKVLYSSYFDKYSHHITFTLDKTKLYEYSLDIKAISKKIEDNYTDIYCVWSPIEYGILDVYVDVSNIEGEALFITKENQKEIYMEDVVLKNLMSFQICGISGIQSMFFRELKTKESSKESPKEPSKEWFIETDGSNLIDVFELDIVDETRTMSNDMWEIYNTFGIEATRQFLIEEYISVVSADGTFINNRHIKILADVMTFTGTITSISRYGINKEYTGPLARASFEISVGNFVKAGVYGEEDKTRGVSASIICGKMPKVGTGMCDIKMIL